MAEDKEGKEVKPEGQKPEPAKPAPAAAGAPKAEPAKPAPAGGAAPPAAAKEAPAKPAVPAPEPWSGDLPEALRKQFPEAGLEALTFRGQNFLMVPKENLLAVANYLKSEHGFTLLADLTAMDFPKDEKRFQVVYQLYSFSRNERLRLKAPVGDGETVESVIPVWGAADWLEREVYDMFGIRFEHHPNLRRILLPDEWQGFPLRKDYPILQQDDRWVQENLHIESGQ
jgi:NADH-quinone oxidoreductase subunit C